MGTKNFVISTILLLAGVTAEAKLTAAEISSRLKQSFDTNFEAKSYMDWELSGKTPDDVFADLAKSGIESQDLCKALRRLSIDEISFFEDALLSHPELASDCFKNVTSQIESYWSHERGNLFAQSASKLQTLGQKSGGSSKVYFRSREIPRNTESGAYYVSGDVGPGEVVLTFDDGPHPTHTKAILNVLAGAGVKAIFFAQGKNAKAYPSITREITDDGHRLGSHSYDHANLAQAGFDRAVANIKKGHQAVYSVNGWVDPFFRFPFGAMTKSLKKYVSDAGVINFFWHIDSNDWSRRKSPNPSALVKNIMRELNHKGRGIILLHDIQRVTREALPHLLIELHQGGYTPVVFVPQSRNAIHNHGLLK